VLRRGIEEVTRNLELILEDEKLSPQEKLRQAIINHLGSLVKHIDNVNVYHSEIRFLSEKKRREYHQTRKYYAECFERIVREIKEKNPEYFKGLDPKIVSFAVLGMCNWTVKWFKKSESYSTLDIANSFYQVVMKQSDGG
jgi:hypothetical protein